MTASKAPTVAYSAHTHAIAMSGINETSSRYVCQASQGEAPPEEASRRAPIRARRTRCLLLNACMQNCADAGKRSWCPTTVTTKA